MHGLPDSGGVVATYNSTPAAAVEEEETTWDEDVAVTYAELNDEAASKYLQYIGILRWAIELGRIDICYEISILSSFSCSLRIGHLNALHSIFSYLKQEHKQHR